MNLATRITTATAIGSLIAATLLPGAAFADSTVNISDNGADSTNGVNIENKSKTDVYQKNETVVLLGITSSASTGGNKANNNTGGDVDITTGNATSNVSVNVTGGSNVATLPTCECQTPTDTVDVINNGAGSTNTVNVKNKKKVKIKQKSNTLVEAYIDSTAKTGKNKAKNNTGPGTTSILTGDSLSKVDVDVASGTNTLNP